MRHDLEHGGERRIVWIAFAVALAIHGVAMLIHLPRMRSAAVVERPRNVVVVRKYIPPPPEIERPPIVRKKKLTRKMPIPDPTPADPEPIREPEPEEPPVFYPDDVEILIGVPEPPPAPRSEPVQAGVGGVTNPILIPESKVSPQYPELARIARMEANVILQAVINTDGHVCDLHVLRCTQEHAGFEEEAIKAVSQWRYEPALQDGRPVEVYFTVFVDFELL